MLEYISNLGFFGWMEVLAMIVGFVYVLLEVKKSHYLWYMCIVASIINIFVYWHNSYLMMLAIQFFYIGNAFYGLLQFRKVKRAAMEEYGSREEGDSDKVAIARFNWKVGGVASLIAVAAYFALVPLVKSYAFSHGAPAFLSLPYFDTFMGVGSMLGTFFLSRSYICQWYFWLLIDSLSVVIFAISGMYFMAALNVVYVVLAVYGARFWHKHGVYVDDKNLK